MSATEKANLDEKIVGLILQSRYRLRFCGVHRGKWRKLIASESVDRFGVGHADEFVRAWEWLDKRGMIY